eukprot:32752_1
MKRMFAVLLVLHSASPVRSVFNETCGCDLWKCNEYEYNTTEFEECAQSTNGCIYCISCIDDVPNCFCDTQAICNINNYDHNLTEQEDHSSIKWWLLVAIAMIFLSCAFVAVIFIEYYKLTHKDHELAMIIRKQKCQATKELIVKAKALKQHLDIKDRRWHLRTYKQCFIGSEAVETMIIANIANNEQQAIIVGNRLIQYNIIEHVEKQHAFKNELFYYRFIYDDFDEDHTNTEEKENNQQNITGHSPIIDYKGAIHTD